MTNPPQQTDTAAVSDLDEELRRIINLYTLPRTVETAITDAGKRVGGAKDAEIAGLRAENEALRKALRPFGEHEDFHAPDDWAVTQYDIGEGETEPGVTAGDFRRARAALEQTA